MRELAYWQGVQEALREEMMRDPHVFLMGEDIGVYGGAFGATRGLLAEFGPESVAAGLEAVYAEVLGVARVTDRRREAAASSATGDGGMTVAGSTTSSSQRSTE